MSVYVLVTGSIRAAVGHTVVIESVDHAFIRAGSSRASLLGGVSAASVVTTGLIFGLPYLALIGIALHGLSVLDYLKTIGQTVGNPRSPLIQEVSWKAFGVVGAVLGIIGVVSPIAAFGVWAVSGALVGYFFALRQKVSLRPRWRQGKTSTRTSLLFGVDYLTGSGVAQVTTWILAGTAGAGVVGGIRAAGTIMGPINIVIAAAESLVLRHLAKSLGRQLRAAMGIVAVLASAVTVLSALVLAIPGQLGEAIFGPNWEYAYPLLVPLSIELVLAVVTSVAYAGLRSLKAAGRSVAIRASLIPIRIGLIVWGGLSFGALGAVWAMALVALLGAISYWSTYVHLLMREGRD